MNNFVHTWSYPAQGFERAVAMITRPLYGRGTSSKPSHTLPDIMRCWDSRPIDEPTTSADVVTVTVLPRALSAAASSVQLDFASETSHAYVRAAGGTLSIPKLTRYDVVVGQSPDP